MTTNIKSVETDSPVKVSAANAERLLKEISASIPGLVYQFKMNAGGAYSFSYVSEGAKTLLGIEPQQIYADANVGFGLVHPDDLVPLKASIVNSAKSLDQWMFTFRISNGDKKHKWIKGNSLPKRSDDGGIVWNGTMMDVTEAKEAEDELRLIRRVMEHAVEGIAICDASRPDYPIIFVNKAFEDLYGYGALEIIGKNRGILLGKETCGDAAKVLYECINERKHFCKEMLLYKKDGTKTWHNLTIAPIPDANGVVTHFVSFHTDINLRKKAEAELKALNESLERKVAERTAELIESNRELETFSYSVSHDLQSPLRILNGYAKLLSKNHGHQLDSEAKNYLKAIEESAVQMSNLVRELLAFSKLGKAKLDHSEVRMKDLVEMVLTDVKLSNPDFKAHVIVKDLKSVRGDFGLLKQVWSNLIDNAVKYSSKKEKPVIEIGMKGSVYYVKDNGAGFDMRYAERLFEVFQRMSNANEFRGTGVGLATVHRIVIKHGGKIWADAEEEKGATFYFSIPQ